MISHGKTYEYSQITDKITDIPKDSGDLNSVPNILVQF